MFDADHSLRLAIAGVVLLLGLGCIIAWLPARRRDPAGLPSRLLVTAGLIMGIADLGRLGGVLGFALAAMGALIAWEAQPPPEVPRPHRGGIVVAALLAGTAALGAFEGWGALVRVPAELRAVATLVVGVTGALATLAIADRARVRLRVAIRRRFASDDRRRPVVAEAVGATEVPGLREAPAVSEPPLVSDPPVVGAAPVRRDVGAAHEAPADARSLAEPLGDAASAGDGGTVGRAAAIGATTAGESTAPDVATFEVAAHGDRARDAAVGAAAASGIAPGDSSGQLAAPAATAGTPADATGAEAPADTAVHAPDIGAAAPVDVGGEDNIAATSNSVAAAEVAGAASADPGARTTPDAVAPEQAAQPELQIRSGSLAARSPGRPSGVIRREFTPPRTRTESPVRAEPPKEPAEPRGRRRVSRPPGGADRPRSPLRDALTRRLAAAGRQETAAAPAQPASGETPAADAPPTRSKLELRRAVSRRITAAWPDPAESEANRSVAVEPAVPWTARIRAAFGRTRTADPEPVDEPGAEAKPVDKPTAQAKPVETTAAEPKPVVEPAAEAPAEEEPGPAWVRARDALRRLTTSRLEQLDKEPPAEAPEPKAEEPREEQSGGPAWVWARDALRRLTTSRLAEIGDERPAAEPWRSAARDAEPPADDAGQQHDAQEVVPWARRDALRRLTVIRLERLDEADSGQDRGNSAARESTPTGDDAAPARRSKPPRRSGSAPGKGGGSVPADDRPTPPKPADRGIRQVLADRLTPQADERRTPPEPADERPTPRTDEPRTSAERADRPGSAATTPATTPATKPAIKPGHDDAGTPGSSWGGRLRDVVRGRLGRPASDSARTEAQPADRDAAAAAYGAVKPTADRPTRGEPGKRTQRTEQPERAEPAQRPRPPAAVAANGTVLPPPPPPPPPAPSPPSVAARERTPVSVVGVPPGTPPPPPPQPAEP